MFSPQFLLGSSNKPFWKTKITYIHDLSKGVHEDFLGGNINVKTYIYIHIYIYIYIYMHIHMNWDHQTFFCMCKNDLSRKTPSHPM